MKRIAIFIDGTWNRHDAEHQTNVVQFSRCILPYDADGNVQQVIYSPGVGSGRGNNRLARRLDRTLGGGLGWGLLDIIEEAYRNLIFAYDPGDEIYIFGFSRGGYAARSLAGLIRTCGILPRRNIRYIPDAMEHYIRRDGIGKPDHEESYKFRRKYAPYTATSVHDLRKRQKDGDTDAIYLTLAYLGIWDTVKALGIPKFIPFSKSFNAQYKFHDDSLSRFVESARHAIAADEKRITFPPSPWDNVEKLNKDLGIGDDQVRPYAQQWFPGDHGSVGGGGQRTGLSTVALHWIAQGAHYANLRFSWEEFDRLPIRYDPVKEKLTNKFGPSGFIGLLLNALKADRDGPKEVEHLSVATLDRILKDDSYAPATLSFIKDDVMGKSASELEALRDWLVARDGGPTHERDSNVRPRAWEKPRDASLTVKSEHKDWPNHAFLREDAVHTNP